VKNLVQDSQRHAGSVKIRVIRVLKTTLRSKGQRKLEKRVHPFSKAAQLGKYRKSSAAYFVKRCQVLSSAAGSLLSFRKVLSSLQAMLRPWGNTKS
jgi:hypothetical protein